MKRIRIKLLEKYYSEKKDNLEIKNYIDYR